MTRKEHLHIQKKIGNPSYPQQQRHHLIHRQYQHQHPQFRSKSQRIVSLLMMTIAGLLLLSHHAAAKRLLPNNKFPVSAAAFAWRYPSQNNQNNLVRGGLRSLSSLLLVENQSSLPTSQRRNNIFQLHATSKQKSTADAAATSAAVTTTTTKPNINKKKGGGRPYKLIIVESPSKCKTIEKILQKYVQEQQLDYDFIVTSCYGHIRNLPKNNQQLIQANLPVPPKQQTLQSSSKFPYSIVGVDLENNYSPTYVLLPGKDKLIRELQSLSDKAQQVLLATDPDREGEAIAWHLQQVLQLSESNSERLTFAEITPKAIEYAVTHPQTLNDNLIEAQETRRILDRLAGFTVSPVLWRKIAPGLSAGRVQSVGMAMCVQRERERLLFQPTNYWDVQGNFSEKTSIINNADCIESTLVSVNGTSLVSGKHDLQQDSPQDMPQPKANKLLLTEHDTDSLLQSLNQSSTEWIVTSVQGRERLSYPPAPFKTSTLQQDSNQRLGLSVSQTMRTAQQLYEAGWISYMRTDATHLSDDAKAATIMAVSQKHGPDKVFQPKETGSTKKKKSKSDKYAQEAHEAIRPAIQPSGSFAHQVTNLPESAKSLYTLIYQRTLASRMPPQKTNQTTITIQGTTKDGTTAEFRATGSVILDPGYTVEWGHRGGDNDKALPPLQEGQFLSCHELEPISHTTQPPPRYTEASLVKELEAQGVGRPSTYAGIVQILRERAYVGSPTSENRPGRSNSKAPSGSAITAQRAAGGGDLFGARGPLVPSLSAFVVTSLLEKHCPTYVDPSFTAQMEENLDRIAQGTYSEDETSVEQQRISYLNEFYADDHGLAAKIKQIDDEIQAEEARKANLPSLNTTGEGDSRIDLLIGPWGPYIQQLGSDGELMKAPLPPGMATDLSIITPKTLKALLEAKQGDGSIMGQHPDDGRNIRMKVGRFGAYLQWGETGEENTTTHSLPKQVSAMKNIRADQSVLDAEDIPENVTDDQGVYISSLYGMLGVTLDEAIGYCGLPRTVSMFHDKPITAAIGPYGPYLKYNNSFVSLNPRDGDVLTIDAETAEQLVEDGIINKKSGSARGVLAELGEKEGNMVTVKSGRFGSYINWKKVNAKLPTEYVDEPETMPLEEAWILIQEKAANPSTKKSSKKKSQSSDNLPPAPKRPKSSFLHFCNEKRPEIASKEKSLGDVSKKLGELWAETTEEERKRFEDLAAAEKAEYLKLKEAWEEECKELGGTNRKSKAATAAASGLPPPPKRPKSSYLFFCDANRAEVSKSMSKLGEVSKELARLWAEVEDKSEFENLAQQDKARYEKEKAEYDQENLTTNSQSSSSPGGVKGARKTATRNGSKVNGAKSSSRAVKKASNTKAKAKRAPSAYIIFCRENRNAIVDENGEKLPLGQTTKRLAEMWKNLNAAERSKFQAMAEDEKQKLFI